MAVLYFGLYLLAFLLFLGAVAGTFRRPDRPSLWYLVALGLAAWVLVSVIASGRALGD